MKQQSAHCT